MKAKWYDRKVISTINYALRGAEERAAKLVAMKAKSTTMFTDRSGILRRSIRATDQPPPDAHIKRGWFVLAGGRGSWGDAWYAPKVELGWVHAAARPFMKAAKAASLGGVKLIFMSIFGKGARFRK